VQAIQSPESSDECVTVWAKFSPHFWVD